VKKKAVKPFTPEEQKTNLETLGRYLARLNKLHNVKHFRMGDFVRHHEDPTDSGTSFKPLDAVTIIKSCFCGAAACAIGHMHIVMPEVFNRAYQVMPDWFRSDYGYSPGEIWAALSVEAFGYSSNSREWNFLFGGHWEGSEETYHSTSWAAADRIAYLLSGVYLDFDNYSSRTFMKPATGASARAGWISRKMHLTRLKWSEEIKAEMEEDNPLRIAA
jgi:hypothetical protein